MIRRADPRLAGLTGSLSTPYRTPSGAPTPEELSGLQGSLIRPNEAQPMPGEQTARGVANGSNTAFFRPTVPPPTGTSSTNGSFANEDQYFASEQAVHARKPVGDAVKPTATDLAGLPQFADRPDNSMQVRLGMAGIPSLPVRDSGGPVTAGQPFVSGRPDETEVTASGKTLPVRTGINVPKESGTVLTPQERALAGIGDGIPVSSAPNFTAPDIGKLPTPEQPGTDAYQKALAGLNNLQAPNRNDPSLQHHGFRKALDIMAGVGMGAASMNPLAGLGMYKMLAGAPYRRAEGQYGDQYSRMKDLAGISEPLARMEQQQSEDAYTAGEDRYNEGRQAQQDKLAQTEAENTPAYYQMDQNGNVTGAVSATGKVLPGAVPQGYVRPEKAEKLPTTLHTINTDRGVLFFNPKTNQYEPVVVNGAVAHPFKEFAPQKDAWIPEYGIGPNKEPVLLGYRNPATMQFHPAQPGTATAKTQPHVPAQKSQSGMRDLFAKEMGLASPPNASATPVSSPAPAPPRAAGTMRSAKSQPNSGVKAITEDGIRAYAQAAGITPAQAAEIYRSKGYQIQ